MRAIDLRPLAKCVILGIFCYGQSSIAQPEPDMTLAELKIGLQLRQELTEKPAAAHEILVYMRAQADLRPAAQLQSKAARGQFVVRALQATAKSSQQEITAFLSQSGLTYTSYYLGNIIAVTGASAALTRELAARQDVSRVLGNPAVHMLQPATAAQLTPDLQVAESLVVEGGIRRTGAERLWAMGINGSGIVIAGQDTGIDWSHPGLMAHYRGVSAATSATAAVNHNYNWHDAIHTRLATPNQLAANRCGYNSPVPCDDHGHGTHTMGTMVGDDGNGNQVGIAPGAKWIGCRNMDAGVGRPSTYLECFQFFLAPWPLGGDPVADANPALAPHIMNNSWGCSGAEGCEGDEFIEVLRALKAAGIMVVVAAGNNGPACGTINDGPAHNSDGALSVGAFDHRNDTIASFSSRGPSRFDNLLGPDLSAPGVSIRSTIPGGGYAGSGWSGTSMAAPHVAGAIALLWSAKPQLRGQIDMTAELLRQSAEPKTSSQTCGGVSGANVPNNTYGSGLLNVWQAAQRAR